MAITQTNRAGGARTGVVVKPERLKTVFLFPNGMVAVCDYKGQQMPDYQGRYEDVRELVERAADADTEFLGWPGR